MFSFEFTRLGGLGGGNGEPAAWYYNGKLVLDQNGE